jgi:Tol biopolymer transport system component
VPLTFTPDGEALLFRESDPVSGIAVLYLLPLTGDRTPKPLMRAPVNASHAALSPDGHWMAYQSAESSPNDIHLRPFPDVESGHWQISTDGGTRPAWAPSGHELLYLDARYRLMIVPFQAKPFAIGNPSAAFATTLPPNSGLERSYDPMPDGKHFLVIKNLTQNGAPEQPNQLRVILNWDEELKRLAPAKK